MLHLGIPHALWNLIPLSRNLVESYRNQIDPFTGAGNFANTNKINVPLGMKNEVKRKTYQEATFCHEWSGKDLQKRGAFELSYER